MDAVTTTFLIIGGVAVVVVVLSLLLGDLPDLLPGDTTMPVVAAFAGVVGFGGAIAASLVPGTPALRAVIAAGCGLVLAFPVSLLVGRLTRAVMHMPTDTTPTREDLLGALGSVVTEITPQRPGEVRVSMRGQPVKLRASAARDIPVGTAVFVVTAESETSVTVEEQVPKPEY